MNSSTIIPAPPSLHERDPIGRLPAAAAATLRAIREADHDLGAVALSLAEQYEQLRRDRVDANVSIEVQRRGLVGRDVDVEKHARLVASMEHERDAISAGMARVNERLAALNARRSQALLRRIEQWLKSLPATAILALHADDVAPKHKGSIADAVDHARAEIAKLVDDLALTGTAPLPAAEAKAIARRQVFEMAARGAPAVGALVASGAPAIWPRAAQTAPITGVAATGGAVTGFASPAWQDTPAVLAWLFRESMIEALEDEIDAIADDSRALPAADRASRRRKIEADLLAAERREESFIRLAEASGLNLSRRAGADPRAVLGLDSDLPATTGPFGR
ncbi:MAG TPA: hypothetical protein VHY35_01660 [Stellaceae bacterium]|jgi:hypothetical protein|nr:hypothetical protein [Stellaceae bacterium]